MKSRFMESHLIIQEPSNNGGPQNQIFSRKLVNEYYFRGLFLLNQQNTLRR